MSPGTRVLVVEGGGGQSRSALATVRALAVGGFDAIVATCVAPSLAGASRHCRGVVMVPPVDDPCFASEVRRELASGGYRTMLVTSDRALVALDDPGAALLDKAGLARRATAAGFPAIPERHFADGTELIACAGDLDYPIVIKVGLRAAEVNFATARVEAAAGLPRLDLPPTRLIVQPWLAEPVTAVAGVVWRGALMASVHQRYLRTWPPGCGPACLAETMEPDDELEGKLLRLLEGYDGIFQAQLVGPHLVDLNPRPYGSMSLAVAAGANLPAVLCTLVAGGRTVQVRGRPHVRYRWLEGDVRHLVQAVWGRQPGRRQLLRSALPHRGTAHSVESFSDPRPLLVRLRSFVGGPR